MSFAFAQACSHKFALYLYKNNHLEDFSIEKKKAFEIFKKFKKEHKIDLDVWNLFHTTLNLKLLKPPKENLKIMYYRKNKLLQLLNKEEKIDSRLKINNNVQKIPAVNHNHSFNNKKSGKTVSQNEGKQSDFKKKIMDHLKIKEHSFFETLNKALRQRRQDIYLQFTVNGSPILNNIILRKNISKTLFLEIKNVSKDFVKIININTRDNIKQVKFSHKCLYELPSLKTVKLELKVHPTIEGVQFFPILFTLETVKGILQDAVELVFHTHDEFYDDLHPKEPFKKPSKLVFEEYIEEIDKGDPPKFSGKKLKVPLDQYRLPLTVIMCLNNGLRESPGMSPPQQGQMLYMTNLLNVENKKKCLTPENYSKMLEMLLFIEEHQMQKNIKDYNKENQVLKKVGEDMFELEVPGLAEHRPSVIVGDSIYLRENKSSTVLYQGYVHKVKDTIVLLNFSRRFNRKIFVKGKKFYVSFTINRYPLRVEHQAVEFTRMDNIAHFFFPLRIPNSPIPEKQLIWFDKNLEWNLEQQQAVRAILQKTAKPFPYLIFGPPGTGKTMTVVESVKQIYQGTNQKILICTPSNNAANEVTRRLIKTVPATDLYRYIAPSFSYSLIPKEIIKYTNCSGGNYTFLEMKEIIRYRIVITTLTTAAKLVNNDCPKNHFDYVFIDESGQATESETLIPIAGILTNPDNQGVISGQIVLAGDPQQLGPIIHSTLAKEYGFGTSMLERLMIDCQPYKKNNLKKYNPNALTKLLKNYRSHQVILDQPNRLFYENELETAGDHLINVALNWKHLPNRKFPLIFHSVKGIDQREKSSPSYFNVQEVQVVMSYLEKLIGCKMQGLSIKENHIGIISPYKKQADKIRQACTKKKYSEDLMVGTVEQFQGQEKLIIIVSAVRSKSDLIMFDLKFHLGFLNNPKRFNVAMTRAKALLIIIGNPNVLQYDKHWRSMISYCKKNNALIGDRFDFDNSLNLEALASQIQNMPSALQPSIEERPNFSRGNL